MREIYRSGFDKVIYGVDLERKTTWKCDDEEDEDKYERPCVEEGEREKADVTNHISSQTRYPLRLDRHLFALKSPRWSYFFTDQIGISSHTFFLFKTRSFTIILLYLFPYSFILIFLVLRHLGIHLFRILKSLSVLVKCFRLSVHLEFLGTMFI